MKSFELFLFVCLNLPLLAHSAESCVELFAPLSLNQNEEIQRSIPTTYLKEPTYGEFRGLHASDFLYSLFKEKVGLNRLPTINGEIVANWIRKPLGKREKIEVGAATNPICSDCTQVDHASSSWDMARGNLRNTYISYVAGFQKDHARRRRTKKRAAEIFDGMNEADRLDWYSHLTASSVEELVQPFAVITSVDGIIADATKIPLQSESVETIVTKNFPWFFPVGIISRTRIDSYWSGQIFRSIESVLIEYFRLLKSGGRVLILTNGNGRPFVLMWNHLQLARRMGFQVSFVGENEMNIQGIVLEKP